MKKPFLEKGKQIKLKPHHVSTVNNNTDVTFLIIRAHYFVRACL